MLKWVTPRAKNLCEEKLPGSFSGFLIWPKFWKQLKALLASWSEQLLFLPGVDSSCRPSWAQGMCNGGYSDVTDWLSILCWCPEDEEFLVLLAGVAILMHLESSSSFAFILDVFSGRGYLQVFKTPPTRPFLNCLFWLGSRCRKGEQGCPHLRFSAVFSKDIWKM